MQTPALMKPGMVRRRASRLAAVAKRRSALQISLQLQTTDTRPPLKHWLPAQFRKVARLAGVTRGHITLAIVDDVRMSELHQRYRGIAGTTDVLTFDLRPRSSRRTPSRRISSITPIEADLAICLDVAKREAKSRGHDTRLEVLLYALHGLLHLLGHDDHAAALANRMHRREDEILSAAGFGPVFAKNMWI